jgi:hypothetical protein
MLGVPRQGLRSILALTARQVAGTVQDCRGVPGPSMHFDLGGFSVRLDAADYSRPAVSYIPGSAAPAAGSTTAGGGDSTPPRAICRAAMLPIEQPQLGPKVFLFGEPLLRKYYTAYDSRAYRVGFALAAQPQPSAVAVPEPTLSSPEPSVAGRGSELVL